jgi:hypothetical protein
LPKAKPSKIKWLDSRLRGNDDFFSVCFTPRLTALAKLSAACLARRVDHGKAAQQRQARFISRA